MSPGRSNMPRLSAALAGIPAGIQPYGPWSGRRQLFVKFAGEAETATIYTADGLREDVMRLTKRSRYHSIAIVGRDALAEHEFLATALSSAQPMPVMLDHDGQRPDALGGLLSTLELVQVTMDGTEGAAALERVMDTLTCAMKKHVAHAAVLVPAEGSSDAQLLRIVEQIHVASETAEIVVHPVLERVEERDRRWTLWLEQAMGVHGDVRVLPRPNSGTPAR